MEALLLPGLIIGYIVWTLWVKDSAWWNDFKR